MTGRSVDEWVGKTPDSAPPQQVRMRVLRRYNFHCYLTGVPIAPGSKWALDHVKALINGGENRESNLAPISFAAHKAKNARDMAEKAKTDAMTKAAFNIKPIAYRPMQSRGFRPVEKRPREPLALPPRRVDPFGRRIEE
jgi:hypothetical protein